MSLKQNCWAKSRLRLFGRRRNGFRFCLCQFGESIGFILCSRYENRTVLNWKPYGFHIENIEYILVPEGMQWGILMIKAMRFMNGDPTIWKRR